MSLGYAIYPDKSTREIIDQNPKLRGFKIRGVRPVEDVLFVDDPQLKLAAFSSVKPGGKIRLELPNVDNA